MQALPRGVRNRNPGNIDRVKGVRWQGQADRQTDRRFVVFTAPEWGIRAIARVLITYQDKRKARDGSKIDTIREIIDRWAPAVENDTNAYVGHVAQLVGIGADETVDVYRYEVMRPLVEAIIAHECAGYRYPEGVINEGLRLAGIKVPLRSPAKSRTAAGVSATGAGLAGSAGVQEIQGLLGETQSQLSDLAFYVDAARWLLIAVAFLGLGLVIYARWSDWKAARR